jgi:hypothetical protein
MTGVRGNDEKEGRQRSRDHDEGLPPPPAASRPIAPPTNQRLNHDTFHRLRVREIPDDESVVGEPTEVQTQDRGIEPVVDPATDASKAIEDTLADIVSI